MGRCKADLSPASASSDLRLARAMNSAPNAVTTYSHGEMVRSRDVSTPSRVSVEPSMASDPAVALITNPAAIARHVQDDNALQYQAIRHVKAEVGESHVHHFVRHQERRDDPNRAHHTCHRERQRDRHNTGGYRAVAFYRVGAVALNVQCVVDQVDDARHEGEQGERG